MEAVTQRLSLLGVALSYGDDMPTCGPYLVCALTELLQVLPTERSTEVAKEGEHQGTIAAQLGERNLAPIATPEDDIRCGLTNLYRHPVASVRANAPTCPSLQSRCQIGGTASNRQSWIRRAVEFAEPCI